MTGLKIEGVVFDVDGVLFDTERLTQQTWLAVSREMGWPQVGEAYLEFVGQNRADIFQKMEDLFGAEFPKRRIYGGLFRPLPGPDGDGGRPYEARRGGGAGAAAEPGRPHRPGHLHRPPPDRAADGDDRPGSLFSAIITGDQVAHSKPDPEIYLYGLQGPGDHPGALWRWRTPETASSPPPGRGCGWPWSPTCCPPTPELEPLLWGRFDSLLQLRDRLAKELD